MESTCHLLKAAITAVPNRKHGSPDDIQDLLAHRMATAILRLSQDYENARVHLSVRSRAVIARAALEAMFNLLGALSSKATAIRIVYSSTDDDLRRARQMKKADPDPSDLADETIQGLEDNLAFIVKSYGNDQCKKINTYQIAESSGCDGYYRSRYFSLSQHVHSNYATLGHTSEEPISEISDKSVLLACALSSDCIAGHYEHPDADRLQAEARSAWKDRPERG